MILDEKDYLIIEMVANGFKRKEIADKVFLSISAVDYRIKRLFQRTGTTNNTELTKWFWNNLGKTVIPHPNL